MSEGLADAARRLQRAIAGLRAEASTTEAPDTGRSRAAASKPKLLKKAA